MGILRFAEDDRFDLDGIFVLFYGGSVHSIFREEHEI